MITEKELREVKQAGAVGEVLGRFFDENGRAVHAELTDRALAHQAGRDRRESRSSRLPAARTSRRRSSRSLESRVLKGLITDEATAKTLVETDRRRGQSRGPARRPNDKAIRRGDSTMYEKGRDLAAAFVRKQMSRRELMPARQQARPRRRRDRHSAQSGADPGHGRRFRLEEAQGHEAQAAAQQASLRRCDDRQPRDLQDADRHGCHL